jgi:hypothetical protein
MSDDDRIECPGCGKSLKRTTSGRYRKHGSGECDFSETVIREEECESTHDAESTDASSATSSPDDAPESAPPATPSTASSPPSPDEGDDASTASALGVLPGVAREGEREPDAVLPARAGRRRSADAF